LAKTPPRRDTSETDHVRAKTVVTSISKITDRAPGKEACLVVIYGNDLGKKYNLDAATLVLGRSSKCDIQIDQESVSRAHSKIINTGKSIRIRDLGSTNGTYVNDEIIEERVLGDGDLIKIGRTIFKFLSGGNIERAYHEEIYRLTTIDGLTQIYNKRYFLESLEREIARSNRYRRDMSLVMFDIDHFKQINDTRGHAAGDEVLRKIAALAAGVARASDTAGRLGGEEFGVLLPETTLADATRFAERLRQGVAAQMIPYEGVEMHVSCSFGVADAGPQTTTLDGLMGKADDALYQAKEQGRNRVVTA
jgi:two-component system, cell cycle response regulator